MSEPTAVYSYHYEDGTLGYQKLRYEVWDDGKRQSKRFDQRRPLPASLRKFCEVPDNRDCWVWGLRAGQYGRAFRDGDYDLRYLHDDHQCSVELPDCRLVCYRLPELLAANPEHPVFLVEGEKDVETLRTLGFVATCTVGTSVIDPDWLAPLGGRRVVIVADNDSKGRKHAQMQAGIILSGGVRSVRIIWPGEGGYVVKDGGDITDWIKDCPHEVNARDLVIALCKKFPEYRIY